MDIEKVHNRIVNLGQEWAEKEAAASILEEARKSVRAQYAVEYLGTGMTIGKAELMAEADPRYKQHVKAMVDARKQANIARVNYKAAETWAELSRTESANKRAEMNLR